MLSTVASRVREVSDPLWETGSIKGVASARVLGWSKFLLVSHLETGQFFEEAEAVYVGK